MVDKSYKHDLKTYPHRVDTIIVLSDVLELMLGDNGTLLSFLCSKNMITDLMNMQMSCKKLFKAVQQGIKNKYKCGMGLGHCYNKINNDSISTSKQKRYGVRCGNKDCKRDACTSCVYICAAKTCNKQMCSYCLKHDFLCCAGPQCPKQFKYYCGVCSLDIKHPRLTKKCDAVGCEHRYHLKKRYQCVSYLGKKCKDCRRSFCHIHRDPKRYVDSYCVTCHRRNCSLCWGSNLCNTCPMK